MIALDMVLALVTALLILTKAKIFLFHLIFLLLTFGAFYWTFRSFVIRSILWVGFTSTVVVVAIVSGEIHHGEAIELPMLTAILVLVFVIARERRRAEDDLRSANEKLEIRVEERTAELTTLNANLALEVAERVQVETELREIWNKNKAILDTIPDSFFQLNGDGKILDWRLARDFSLHWGIVTDEMQDKQLSDFLPSAWVDLERFYLSKALDTGQPQVFKYQHSLPESQRDFEMRLVVSGPDEVLAIVRDITTASKLERQRTRAFHDLHDGLGQCLGYLNLKLTALIEGGSLPDTTILRHELEEMNVAVNHGYDLVRDMLASDQTVNTADLESALLVQAKMTGRRNNFEVRVTHEGDSQRLSPLVQQQILYICREALFNVAKHADAQNVAVNLVWAQNELTTTISDDGRGFLIDGSEREGHYGLNIMLERAAKISGRLEIASQPGCGTHVTLRLPLGQEAPPY